MKTIDATVEVGTDKPGWNFPGGHPTRTSKTGDTFYVIPVKYMVEEESDNATPEARQAGLEAAATFYGKIIGANEVLAACIAGLKLAAGDAAKAPYKTEGTKKVFAQALQWASEKDDLTTFTEYRKALKEAGTDEKAIADAKGWLIEEYQGR